MDSEDILKFKQLDKILTALSMAESRFDSETKGKIALMNIECNELLKTCEEYGNDENKSNNEEE